MGRIAKSADEVRSRLIAIRFTPVEKWKIEQAANNDDRSVSEWIRKAALDRVNK